MIHLSQEEIDSLPITEKIALINSLPGLKSVNLIGTISDEGQHNLAIFSTTIHLGSNPPLLGFMHRPVRHFGHTMQNILSTRQYTINHISPNIQAQAHLTNAKYPAHISEFDEVGLTPYFIKGHKAPFVVESKIKIGLQYIEHHTLANESMLVVGQVTSILYAQDLRSIDGSIDIIRAESIGVVAQEKYVKAVDM